MLFAGGDQLGGEQACQKIEGNRVFDHKKQLMVQIDQLIKGGKNGIHIGDQLLILFVKQGGKGAEQGILSGKVVIEGPLGGAGAFYNIVYRGIIIAVFIKKLPSGGDNTASGISGTAFRHGASSCGRYGIRMRWRQYDKKELRDIYIHFISAEKGCR